MEIENSKMPRKIYFVDEDAAQIQPYVLELIIRGHHVKTIGDADDAFDKLNAIQPLDVDLVIIDIMLATNPIPSLSRFSRDKTEEFKITGLVLLEDLIKRNSGIFPEKSIFFSMASSKEMQKTIREFCQKYQVQFYDKAQFNTCYEFGDKIEEILGIIKRG